MKKILFAIIGIMFSIAGCKQANNSAAAADKPNAKTVLVLQNQSSLSLANIKYCGKEIETLMSGKTWSAQFTDATQGYIYFDLELGGSKVNVRTQETVIIEKDK